MKKDLNELYLQWIQTNKDTFFNQFYNGLKKVFIKKFANNSFFANHEFDDIYQEMIIKLISNKLNLKMGNVVTYSYKIFKNLMIDVIRKEQTKQKYIDYVKNYKIS